MSLWSLREVNLTSQGTARLDNVSVDIEFGVTAVLGYSGAGKTSLLNLMVEFERATSGNVMTMGASFPDDGLPVFWVPQNGGLWNHVNAARHIQMVTKGSSDDWLDRFDLTSRASAMPAELSQGERARLSVARALASNAAVLVMDEPLAHVDPARVGTYFDRVIEHLQAGSGEPPHGDGRSLVFSTHQPELVLRYAQNVVCLDDGKCVFSGSVRDLYENPADSRLATLLGHGNWISKDENLFLLDQGVDALGVVRPEHLLIEPSDHQHLAVVSSRSLGPVRETTLRHVQTDRLKTFIHLNNREFAQQQWVAVSVLSKEPSEANE